MKALMFAATLAVGLIESTRAGVPDARQAPSTGVYQTSPEHLWNRLRDALFVRAGSDGRQYGRDRVEPLLWRGSRHLLHGESHDRLLAVLDEFLDRRGERLLDDPVRRALLQRDLWLVFSWLEHGHDEFSGFGGNPAAWKAAQERLRVPLARAIGRLTLTAKQIAELPDTYAAAAAFGEFPARFDPAHPDRAYLPPDLAAADGPWVSLGRGDNLIAPSHLVADNPFTNSAFAVFIKLPGGRVATLDYINRLTRFQGPMFVRSSRTAEPEFPYFNPAIPQFPARTEVALVRRALLVTSAYGAAVSPITEGVELRVYRDVPVLASPEAFDLAMLVNERTRARQAVFEFVLSRRRLFGGRSGGLREGAADYFRTGPSTHGVDGFEEGQVSRLTDAQVRSGRAQMCFTCHPLPGVYSFNTFTEHFTAVQNGKRNPLVATRVQDVLASGVRWKERRPDWLLLRRLLTDSAGSGEPAAATQSNRALLLQPDHPEMNRRAPDISHVRLETTKGTIRLEMRREWAPHGVDRFYNLARHGYYDDTAIFRIRAGTWAQFGINGDPKVAQTWRHRTIRDDPRVLSNVRGMMAYAFKDPNGRTTQVFINLRDNSATHDAEPFVPFAKVIEGMDVADALYAEYGEKAGGGIRAGKQDLVFLGGNTYLRREFPRLDFIVRAIVD